MYTFNSNGDYLSSRCRCFIFVIRPHRGLYYNIGFYNITVRLIIRSENARITPRGLLLFLINRHSFGDNNNEKKLVGIYRRFGNLFRLGEQIRGFLSIRRR